MTGRGQEKDKPRALDGAVDDHLTKPGEPVTLTPLLAAIATI
jgi:DNA-binding response OmpR family regulator